MTVTRGLAAKNARVWFDGWVDRWPDAAVILAFALSRLARGPYEPTPIGVFRAVERPEYGEQMSAQIIQAQTKRGLGDVAALLRSGSSWTVD